MAVPQAAQTQLEMSFCGIKLNFSYPNKSRSNSVDCFLPERESIVDVTRSFPSQGSGVANGLAMRD